MKYGDHCEQEMEWIVERHVWVEEERIERET